MQIYIIYIYLYLYQLSIFLVFPNEEFREYDRKNSLLA